VLRARLAVAAVGLPVLALLVASPEAVFAAAVTITIGAAAYELVYAAAPGAPRPIAVSAAVATALIVVWMRQLGDDFPLWALLALPAIALYGLLRPGPGPRRLLEAWWLGGVVYIGVLGAHWVLLREVDDGRSWIIVLLGVTFATDTGAYAVGRLLGSHHMAPSISPGKTWEGAAGGYLAGAVAAVALPLALEVEPSTLALVVIAATTPLAAELGDLIESALKRRIGVKDTSKLLPGHGGLLDRMDSLLLAGPWLYWMVQWL
jgi:phosphatidate cytidylyltransferase